MLEDARPGLTAGVDIGTSSVKAVVVDGDGTILARARIPHRVIASDDGEFAHDVDEAWRDGVLAALGVVVSELADDGRPIEAVDVSAMVPSLGAVDADGHGIGPGLIYGDRRGEQPGYQPSFPGDTGEVDAFLAWHAAHAPDAAGFWPAQAVANRALCGHGAVDHGTAMTAFPLFDLERWDADRVSAAGTTVDRLAEVLVGLTPAGQVLDGLPAAGALVGGGTVDAYAEQLVSGANEVGDVVVLCGTTLITWVVTEGWLSAPGLWAMPHVRPELAMLGGPSTAGGMFLDTVRRWVGPTPFDAIAGLHPGDLPVWLPYVRGERAPFHRRDLRASLHDASHRHGPEHVAAAAVEASAFVVRHHLDLAREAGAASRRIIATGGGTRSQPWMQALADVTGLPVHVAAEPEGAAIGAAFLARCVAGLEASPRDATRWACTDRIVAPRDAWTEAADVRYQRFRHLTAAAVG